MPKRSSANAAGSAIAHKAVIYARVSSKEQDREGFSIDAQLKLLRNYAEENGIRVYAEYVDVETAKVAGRTQFNAMITYLRRNPAVDTVLVEKTDRLYRNLRDWVTVDEFDIDVHLVKEGTILSQDSRSSEKFMHGIKVLMAKNYIDNLSEEARKGMLEKAEQGIWPTVAPLGYRNVVGPSGKKIIEVDPETAPGVVRLFEWYATGRYSLKDAASKARREGMVYRRSLKPVATGTVHTILRHRIYTGQFEWLGERYQGSHEPLISIQLWEKVQALLDGRSVANSESVGRQFLFKGLFRCGHCGCLMTGDIKKNRYVYYRCTHFKGKCPEPYVREEMLIEQVLNLIKPLAMTEQMYAWLAKALKENSLVLKREQASVIDRLRRERDDIRDRLKQAYLDNIDGKIDDTLFARLSADYRADESKVAMALERRMDADLAYLDRGIELVGLAKDARKVFQDAGYEDRRRILTMLLSNCSYADGKVTATFRKPFDFMAESLPRSAIRDAVPGSNLPTNVKWLPG